MTAPLYACAAQTGREMAVQADLADLGIWAWVAQEVRPVRPPTGGKVIASKRPMWPGYVFARLDAAMFFEVRNVRHLHSTKLQLSPRHDLLLMRHREQIAAKNERATRQIEAGEKLTDWKPGARLEVIDGAFKDRLATFARIVDGSGAGGFRLRLELDGMALPVEVDPADVREAG